MSDQISISLVTGFGFCAQKVQEFEPDGTRVFTYRYLPPGLWHNDGEGIRTLINLAANVFPTYDEFPADFIPAPPVEGADELTAKGKALFESCPIYARFEAKEPWMTWHQHHPEGGISWSIRANAYEPLMHTVLSEWPINLWAQKFLTPWKSLLEPHPKHGHLAMYMQPPLPRDSVPEVDEEGWYKDVDILRADVHERVEDPWGLHKVLLYSCEEDRVEGCKKMEFGSGFQLLPCSLALRFKAEYLFEWREHHVWRFEQPVQLLPGNLSWLDREKVASTEQWAVKTIAPCYAWETPEIRYQLEPEEAGWDMAAVVYKPLSELDPVALAKYEHDIVNFPRPPKP